MDYCKRTIQKGCSIERFFLYLRYVNNNSELFQMQLIELLENLKYNIDIHLIHKLVRNSIL